ncbi:MAG: hypothetical protein WCQ00_00375 [bacterium]
MIETLKKFKYLIIIIVVLIVAFIAYTIYTSGAPTTDSSTLQKTSVDTSTTGAASTGSVVPNNELAKSFVDQLLAIQSVDLKVAYFKDPIFLGLVDNHLEIQVQEIGRPNPFAPIGSDSGQSSGSFQDISGNITNTAGTSTATSSAVKSPVLVPKTATSSAPAAATSSATKKKAVPVALPQ